MYEHLAESAVCAEMPRFREDVESMGKKSIARNTGVLFVTFLVISVAVLFPFFNGSLAFKWMYRWSLIRPILLNALLFSITIQQVENNNKYCAFSFVVLLIINMCIPYLYRYKGAQMTYQGVISYLCVANSMYCLVVSAKLFMSKFGNKLTVTALKLVLLAFYAALILPVIMILTYFVLSG